MNERYKETIKLAATLLGNIAAIAFGVALFEQNRLRWDAPLPQAL